MALTTFLTALTTVHAGAKPVKFTINDPTGRDIVSFSSVAPLEMVQGNTSRVLGNVTIDDSLDLSRMPLEAQFDVDLRTLDTGIAMRNEDMRDDFLETTKYPLANFTLKSLKSPPKLTPGKTERLIARGEFTLHGHTKPMIVPVDVTYFPSSAQTQTKVRDANLIQISAEFPIIFEEWEIKRPQILFQKLADLVQVKLNATAYCQIESQGKNK
jgi:polyisoprenoid-binding protein YceI